MDGASGYATAGPLVLYVRGEYQYSPSVRPPRNRCSNFFNSTDSWPTGPALPVASISRFRLLDTYWDSMSAIGSSRSAKTVYGGALAKAET